MAEEIADGVQRDATLNQPGGEVVAQIMPAKSRDLRALEDVRPCRLEPRRDIKYLRGPGRLLAPALQETHGFVIQRYVTRLAALRICAFDRQQPAIKVDRGPAQLEKFTASKPGVHGKEHSGRQVITEAGQGWKQAPITLLPPGIRRLACADHFVSFR